VTFANQGPGYVRGALVMVITSAEQDGCKDMVYDPKYKLVVVAFNACAESVDVPCPVSADALEVHPDLVGLPHVSGAHVQGTTLTLPSRTFCAFVQKR
jgi:hypothetical protein